MKGYIAFIKKEFVENLKNYRFFILFTIFAIFGLSSAFLAKFTPEIIEALGAGFEATEDCPHPESRTETAVESAAVVRAVL